MLTLYYLIFLAIIQGITEFLPISSSGHLVLMHGLLDEHRVVDPTMALEADRATYNKLLDIAMHLGTLLAVCTYFYRDLLAMILGGFDII
jgi:undecaprenyl-diphosphatase